MKSKNLEASARAAMFCCIMVSLLCMAVDDLTADNSAKAARKAEPRILLERQYRHAAQSMMKKIPAGRVDDGEDCAHRRPSAGELLEETGYAARQLEGDRYSITLAQVFSTEP